MFGKVDQMSRDEVEARLSQLLGNVVEASLENKSPDPVPEQIQEDIDTMTDKEEEEKFEEGWTGKEEKA